MMMCMPNYGGVPQPQQACLMTVRKSPTRRRSKDRGEERNVDYGKSDGYVKEELDRLSQAVSKI